MFLQLFNIGNNKPVREEESAPVRIRPVVKAKKAKKSTKPEPVQAAPVAPAVPAAPVLTQEALDIILENLYRHNNPKVDALRMLSMAMETGDYSGLIAFCKEPIKAKKVAKKAKY